MRKGRKGKTNFIIHHSLVSAFRCSSRMRNYIANAQENTKKNSLQKHCKLLLQHHKGEKH